MSFAIAPLMDYVVELTPRYSRPEHLAPYVARLERARLEPLRLCVSVPPRFEKTETTLHGIAWHQAQDPSLQVVFASYAARLAEKKSRKLRELARLAGVPIAEDASSRADWRTGVGDGGCWATGVEGALTGEGADLVVVDDPHKDRASAESAVQRQAIFDWFNDVVMTRLEPGGSVVVIQTRWHEDDLVGRLVDQGWALVNLPAVDEAGRSLDPSRFTAEQLARIREQIGEYSWWSLYMGAPRPRGGQLFGDVVFYDQLPERYSISIGVDLAYSAKTKSDWSVAIVLARAGDVCFVLDVIRVQEESPKFQARLAGLRSVYPGAAWRAYLAGTEKGVSDLFAHLGSDVGALPPVGDKFIRAQPVAARWNASKVLLPRSAPWLNAFVLELKTFTGKGDKHDDQVDALAAAHDVASNNVASQAQREREEQRELQFVASLALVGGPVFAPFARDAIDEVIGLEMTEPKRHQVLTALAAGADYDTAFMSGRHIAARAQAKDRAANAAAGRPLTGLSASEAEAWDRKCRGE